MTFQYQDIAEPIPPPFPETVTESRWHQPWSEPVKRVFAVALIAGNQFAPVTTPTVAPSFGWYAAISQPQRLQNLLPPTEFAWGYFTPAAPTVNLGWYAALAEPAGRKQARTEQTQYLAFYPLPVAPLGWGGPYSEPTSLSKIIYQSIQEPPYAVAAPPAVPSFGWYAPLETPTPPTKHPTPTELAYSYFTPGPAAVNFGWYEEFSLPTFTVRQRLAMDLAWGYFTPVTPPPPPPPGPIPLVGTVGFGPALVTGPQTPPGEVYIAPRKGRGKGAGKSRSDYPKWPGWGRY